MGEAAETSHMEGKKNTKLLDIRKKSTLLSSWAAPKPQACTTSGAKGTATSTPEPSTSASTTSMTSTPIPNPSVRNSIPTTMDSFVTKSVTLSSEIYWCLHVVTSHSSYTSSAESRELFQKMFPDSVIVKEFKCGETKCAHLARFGTAPHFKSLMQCDIYQAEAFVLLFDESLNFENQKKQLDMHVRYWQHDQVSTRYFGSECLGKGDADHLVKSFLQNTETLQLGKLIQIGMDGPNVNLKFHREMVSHVQLN